MQTIEPTTAGLAALNHAGRSLVTGGLLIAAVVFLVVVLLLIVFYAWSLGGRTRHGGDAHERPSDQSRVIGRFPRPRATANTTMRVSREVPEINQKASS